MKNATTLVITGLVLALTLFSCSKETMSKDREFEETNEELQSGKSEAKAPKTFEGRISVQSRSFASFRQMALFAKSELGAEIIYEDGQITGIKGSFLQKEEVQLVDEEGQEFEAIDFIAAYLGGREGVVRIDGQELPLLVAGSKNIGSTYISPVENCIGNDCVTGESWVTHTSFLGFGYHSAGSKTIQSSGGLGTVNYNCCGSGGTLVYQNGILKCRYRNPGAWEFDPELKQWIPTGNGPLYTFGDVRQCGYQALRNTLTARATFVFPDGSTLVCNDCDKSASNTDEVTASEYLITYGPFDLSPHYLDDVIGVCGNHYSTHGGSIDSSAGDTNGACP